MDKQPNFVAITSLTLTLIAATLAFFIYAFSNERKSIFSIEGKPAENKVLPAKLSTQNPALAGTSMPVNFLVFQ